MVEQDQTRYPPRRWYRKVPFISTKPRCEPLSQPSLDPNADSNEWPEMKANWLSLVSFHWLNRVLGIGYTRPLQAEELYSMPQHRKARVYAQRLEEAWSTRVREAKEKGEKATTSEKRGRRAQWRWRRKGKEERLRSKKSSASLTMTLNEVCFQWFWSGGALKLVGDLAIITSPLLVREIIDTLGNFSPESMRRGFGLAVGIFLLLVLSVTANVHGFYRSYSTGIALRGALMHVIYVRATTKIGERSRIKSGLSVGKLLSLMSADVSRIDFCCGFFHSAWTSIIQILVCLALMIYSLSYSALPGFALLLLLYPLQTYMVKKLYALRRASMKYTDARIKAVVEAVSAVRLVKTFAYESAFLERIRRLRNDEMIFLRKRLLLRSLNTAVSYTAPTLAAVVSFVCYGAVTGSQLDSGRIFSSLTFFLLLRTPLQMLPVALNAIADAKAAIERLEAFMQASDDDPSVYQMHQLWSNKLEEKMDGDVLMSIHDASFAHHDDDEAYAATENTQQSSNISEGDTLDERKESLSARLHIDSLEIKKGKLTVIAGPVGSGKSSLLQAMMGNLYHMNSQEKAECQLGSHLAYCAQSAWLLSDTVRENIVFGRPFDQQRYEDILQRCCLLDDLTRLSDGDMTVVGEKGISLSGGQKQRLSIARALYGGNQLLLLDDCFSALDAHIGAQVFDNVISKQTDCTFVLVTHSLTFMSHADHIVYMDKGRIVEQGSYEHLLSQDGSFCRLAFKAEEKGEVNEEEEEKEKEKEKEKEDEKDEVALNEEKETSEKANKDDEKSPKEIMQKEERLVGSVNSRTYLDYVLMGNAAITLPLFLASIVVYQATSILSPLWLSWWETRKYANVSTADYMVGYAAFGIGQSLGLFCMSAAFAVFCFYCSNHLHHQAIRQILYAPISFFDTTPQGRVTHRFSKDVDAVDNVVGETLRIFISTAVQALGSIILVAIILPWFLIIAAVVVTAYIWTGMYYRPSSRELRRLNNLLRSRIYEHFSESISGLATLKAYGALDRFTSENAKRIDSENRAYWLSIACQRWLNLRLDLFGATLVLCTALLVVGLKGIISPSQGGVVLSYIVTVQAVFGNMIRQSAEIENNMNSIERLLYYAKQIQQEAPHHVKGDDQLKSAGWPSKGHIRFNHLTASHRPELPPSLIDITLDIKPGQKIGVVGRTGAGKSTLLNALLRLMEPSEGQILIDNVDVATVGLQHLRSKISVISQDAVLFAGTLRYNLDPFGEHDDSQLWNCVKQACLVAEEAQESATTLNVDQASNVAEVEKTKEVTTNEKTSGTRLTLDFEVAEEGANLSQGQRALISIARAMVKKSKIVILDEATASVDSSTDAHIQDMLHLVLRDSTVITVAHRLDTIIGTSDMICVMDAGRVAEYAPPLQLFNVTHGLFRTLCQSAGIDNTDIERAQLARADSSQ